MSSESLSLRLVNLFSCLPKSARVLAVVSPWMAGACFADSVLSFRAVCFDPSQASPPEFQVPNGEAREAVRIPKNDIGGPFKASLREDSFVDFFASASGEKPAFSVKVPTQDRDRLLLLIVPAGESKYQGSAVALPASGFEGGSSLAFNLCRNEIAVRQGNGEPERLTPGAHRMLSLPASHKDDMIPVQILSQVDAKWQPVQSTRWAVDRRFRSYLFLFTSPRGKVTLHAIPERLADE
jgi:hypothetical protein